MINTFVFGAKKVTNGCARQFLRTVIRELLDQVRILSWLECITCFMMSGLKIYYDFVVGVLFAREKNAF